MHRAIGPGLLESAYQACFRQELLHAGLAFKAQLAIPVRYRGVRLDCGYSLDFLVNDELVVELKALLINFNVQVLRHGITSVLLNPPKP